MIDIYMNNKNVKDAVIIVHHPILYYKSNMTHVPKAVHNPPAPIISTWTRVQHIYVTCADEFEKGNIVMHANPHDKSASLIMGGGELFDAFGT